MHRIRIPVSFKNALTVSLTGLCLWSAASISLASDWVEEGVSDIAPNSGQRQPIERAPVSTPGFNSGSGSDSGADSNSDFNSNSNSESPFDTPPQMLNQNQDDQSGPDSSTSTSSQSGNTRNTSKPLEATISTVKTDYRRPSRFPGLDGYANNVMQNAPMIPLPQKDEAVNPPAYKSWLSATHAGITENLNRESIIEVKGKWDDSGHVLHSFGIPCKRVSPNELGDTNLDNVYVVVVNCAGDLPTEAILALRRYVGMGGYLLTTDWALDGVLKKTFPGYVTWNGGYTESGVVDAVIVDPDPRLFKNCPPTAFWKLDKKSQTVKVNRPGEVRVLARSRLLSRSDPSQFGILAFTLDFRQGRVLHLVGHFDNNSDRAFNNALPDPAPGIQISLRQALAANFIVEAIKNGRNR